MKVHILPVLLLCLAKPALACTVSSGTLSFGVINPLADGQRDSSTAITVSCPTTTPYTIALSTGAGTYNQRTLLSGSNALYYNLYTDTQRTQIWGDGSGSTYTISGSAGSAGTQHTIYGSIPAQPLAVPGSYAETVVITVTY